MRRRFVFIVVATVAILGLECTAVEDAVRYVGAQVDADVLLAEVGEVWPALSRVEPRPPAAGAAAPGPSVAPAVSPTSEGESGEPAESEGAQAELPPPPSQAAEPEPAQLPPPEALPEPVPELVSIARETWVHVSPSWSSRKLGYLRAGAVVEREPELVTKRGCRGGWYRLVPRGHVCVGSTASLESTHPVAQLSSRRPVMTTLPYVYAISRFPPPPLYARLPSVPQQRKVEPKRDYHLRKHERLSKRDTFVPLPPADPIPELLRDGRAAPGLGGSSRGDGAVSLGPARVKSAFALLATYDHEGRRFGLTTDLALLPLDRTRIVAPSSFRGVQLSDEYALPIAFVQSRRAQRYRQHEPSGAFIHGGELGHREVVNLTGQGKTSRGHRYLEATDGSWLRADQVIRVDGFTSAPAWARQGKKWIDVSILRQTLVAYEGTRPVYATLVSTGVDGLGDPETTHSTVQGTFLIHTKHVTVTMDGDERGDEFDFRDVPFVQYFTEGYALHGTYWHDAFGAPRSHGCVNLAPVDAAWLFGWTTPEVPAGWHAALSLKQGTVVHVHP